MIVVLAFYNASDVGAFVLSNIRHMLVGEQLFFFLNLFFMIAFLFFTYRSRFEKTLVETVCLLYLIFVVELLLFTSRPTFLV